MVAKIDWTVALENAGEMPDLLKELAEVAVTETGTELAKLDEAIQREDAAAAQLAAHTLKGLARIFSPVLEDQLFVIERQAGRGDCAGLAEELAAVRPDVLDFAQQLRDYLDNGAG